MRLFLFVFSIVILIPTFLTAQCNGSMELCDKRYDQVAYVTTHNAFNADEDGFSLPNQTYGLTTQLEDGVRGLMLDVYDEGGVATVYHGFAFLGTATLADNLTEVKTFLDGNPNEVVTIIFESYVDVNMMESVFTNVGLLPYLHEQSLGEEWPTLQQMIDNGKRLVVLSDENDAGTGQEWYHYVWDFAVETGFSNNSSSDFSCEFNRGDSVNDLFILNHFVTDATLGTGQSNEAAVVNAFNFFYPRALDCQTQKQKFPNFLTVDFYELGSVFEVADSLNGVPFSTGVVDAGKQVGINISSGNELGMYRAKLDEKWLSGQLEIRNAIGQLLELKNVRAQSEIQIDLRNYLSGIYFIRLTEKGSVNSSTIKLLR